MNDRKLKAIAWITIMIMGAAFWYGVYLAVMSIGCTI